jgi:hypothetical protein
MPTPTPTHAHAGPEAGPAVELEARTDDLDAAFSARMLSIGISPK